MSAGGGSEVDPRRALWRRGSYEIAGDWFAPASRSVLDDVASMRAEGLDGVSLLDLACGTGAVSIEAARRGASVVGLDLTDELIAVARRRAAAAGVDLRLELGDFDHLDRVVDGETFDVITSSFGLIFAPDAAATLRGIEPHLRADGVLAVAGWDPESVFVVPDSMLALLPEVPRMVDMSTWTTQVDALARDGGWAVAATRRGDHPIAFASVVDAADQLERWSGGWTQFLEGLDALGHGSEARRRLRAHLSTFAETRSGGITVTARYHTVVLRPPAR
ncbi:MAG: methyltransferase domain-containing protein [Actinomycetota bacterium]